MKKLLSVLLLAVLLSACSNDAGPTADVPSSAELTKEQTITETTPEAVSPLPIHTICADYLEELSVTNCFITDCPFETLSDIPVQMDEIRLSDLSDRLWRAFKPYYKREERTDYVHPEDMVEISLTVKGKDAAVETVMMAASTEGGIFHELQNALCGVSVGGKTEVQLGEIEGLPYYSQKKFLITVNKAYACSVASEQRQRSLEMNGLTTPALLYEAFLKGQIDGWESTVRYKACRRFWNACLDQCTFSLSEDEIVAYAAQIVEEITETAAMMQMTREEFWEAYRQTINYADASADLYTFSVAESRKLIEITLLVGAVAQKEKIAVSEEAIEQFGGIRRTETSEYIWKQNGYAWLENEVAAFFHPELRDNRVYQLSEVIADPVPSESAEGEPLFSETPEIAELSNRISAGIAGLNAKVLAGTALPGEQELMKYYPCTRFDRTTGKLKVLLVAEAEELEHAIRLFKELIGDYEIEYVPAKMEDVTGHAD